MSKDTKIGVVLGAALVVLALVVISVLSSSVEQRHGGAITQKRRSFPVSQLSASPGQAEEGLSGKDVESAVSTENKTEEQRVPAVVISPRIHVVSEGETLTSISLGYYSEASGWKKILQANRGTITDADKVRPGMRLVIPD